MKPPTSTILARSREHDELILMLLQMRRSGLATPAIAARLRMKRSAVSVATLRVLEADLSYPDPSETEEEKRRYYW